MRSSPRNDEAGRRRDPVIVVAVASPSPGFGTAKTEFVGLGGAEIVVE